MDAAIYRLAQRIIRRIKILLIIGVVLGYNMAVLCWVLFIGGILPYLILTHSR